MSYRPNNIGVAINSFTEQSYEFKKFIYGYHYDARKRQIERKIPGMDYWDYTVYNNLNQAVLSQNGKQYQEGKWLFTKYDALGREIITGIYNSSSDRLTLQR